MTDRLAPQPILALALALWLGLGATAATAIAQEVDAPTDAPVETSVEAASAPQLPPGFLDVVLGSKIDAVKRALPLDSDLFEVEDIQDCPLAPAQKCLRIIEKVPRKLGKPYKKAEYLFNPFTQRLVLIEVVYRLDKMSYLDVRDDFHARWGTPTSATETPVEKEAFWPEGIEHSEVWSGPPIEVQLSYRTFPSRPDEAPLGHVRFVHLDQKKLLDDLGTRINGLLAPESTSGESTEEEPATRLF